MSRPPGRDGLPTSSRTGVGEVSRPPVVEAEDRVPALGDSVVRAEATVAAAGEPHFKGVWHWRVLQPMGRGPCLVG